MWLVCGPSSPGVSSAITEPYPTQHCINKPLRTTGLPGVGHFWNRIHIGRYPARCWSHIRALSSLDEPQLALTLALNHPLNRVACGDQRPLLDSVNRTSQQDANSRPTPNYVITSPWRHLARGSPDVHMHNPWSHQSHSSGATALYRSRSSCCSLQNSNRQKERMSCVSAGKWWTRRKCPVNTSHIGNHRPAAGC